VVSVGALAFTFWALAGSGYQAAYYGIFCLLLGVPVYVWLKVERREYGEATPVPSAGSA
jgi:basic amino acid/polyamine antiporter, APA family